MRVDGLYSWLSRVFRRLRQPQAVWEHVVRESVDAVKRDAANLRPDLAWAFFFGALDIDARHLAVHYGFATDADLDASERSGLQAAIRAQTLSELSSRGFPAAALEHVCIGFASQEDIDRTTGGDYWQYFK